MAELKLYSSSVFGEKRVKENYTKRPELPYKKIFDNKKMVDTAGFVPLDVRIKQFLISGEQYKMSAEMFDSDDWRYMYNNINDTQLEVGDDLEEVRDKLQLVLERQKELLIRKGLIKPKETVQDSEEANTKSEAKSKSAEKTETVSEEN